MKGIKRQTIQYTFTRVKENEEQMRAKRLFRLTKHFLLIKLEHQSNRVACAVCRCTLVNNNNNFVKRGDARTFQAHIVVFLHRNIPFTRNAHRMPTVVIVAVTAPDDVRFRPYNDRTDTHTHST